MILIEWTSFPREIPWCRRTFNQILICVSVERPTQRGLSRTPLMYHYGSPDSNLCFLKPLITPDTHWSVYCLCWRRLLGVLWNAKRSNQSTLKEINPEYSLEGLLLKLYYFGHLVQRVDSLKKTLMLGKTEGKKRRGQQRMRGLDSITDSMDVNLSKLREILEDGGASCTAVHGITKSQTWLSDQTPPPVCQHHGNLFFSALLSAVSWAPRRVSRVW